VNTLKIEPSTFRILPIENDFEKGDFNKNYEFDEEIEAILDTILPLYLENVLYGLILDSKASEHASRMTAMSSATDITSITSIGSGASVLLSTTGPNGTSPSSAQTTTCYTQYIVTQVQTTSSASAGDSGTVTLTVQYNEN
jgi:hypothetical protein